MPEFSLDLNEEQRELRDWVHGFAAEVVRPAAAEWDEREETPWPVIQEAAKIGLYGFEFLANTWADPTGLSHADRQRGAVLGRRRHRHGASSARRSRSPRSTAPAPRSSWSSGCRSASATPTSPKVGRVLLHRAGGRLRRGARCAPGRVYDEATDEWVLNGQKAYATNGGIADVHVVTASVDPELGSRGQAAFVVPPGTPGLARHEEAAQARPARLAHGRRLPRRRAGARRAACSAARRRCSTRLDRARSGRAVGRARRRCARSS